MTADHGSGLVPLSTHPFDDDKLREECGVFGVWAPGEDVAKLSYYGLYALQHRGQEGAELSFEKQLSGKAGARRVIKDRLGRVVEAVGDEVPPVDGQDVQLSIDSKVQFFAYQKLRDAVTAHKAKSGSVVVLDAQTGEVLALVGENGAGKTTLVKLLARLYDPDEGRILLDGRDLKDYDLDDLRANIGVIFQDFVRYHLTAAENIGVGQIDAMDDRARIEQAARKGMADEVIDDLPRGYEQVIGRRFKDGVDLSGGQWQKIAIARAYMRDAQVMILDEPTAALDARAEYEVFKRFKELSEDRTAVLISHRFSSVRMADRILVLAGGKVEASGTHDQLMAEGGRYAELFELQAAGYR